MAGTFHVSEEDASRDFPALLRRVDLGEEVIVEGGGRPIAVIISPADHTTAVDTARIPGKTAKQILESLAVWKSKHGTVTIDEDFAADVAEAHERLSQPLAAAKWD